ncbi:ATP-binding cassette domain-containing protein [bacterium]|nr:ATP-binding cassette domain-containing protein [bacterium]
MAYEITLITTMAISILFALSLNFITGFCGQISLGHAAFMGVGAYTSAVMIKAGCPFLLTIPFAIVPEGRRIFPDLNVRENLMVGGHIVSTSIMNSGIEMVYEFFPQLYERQTQAAGSLSGGEQQMLAMGRALISRPKILIVDELSLGLMPKVVDECYEVLNKLKSESIGILLVEQNTERAFSVADDISALEAGNLFWSGTAEQARANIFLKEQLMGVT